MPSAEPDQHQAVYGAVHRGDHVAGDALAAHPDDAVAELAQLLGQGAAVAKKEEQRQQA